MKRIGLIKAIEEMGCDLIRHGGHHLYRNRDTGVLQPVPRHRDFDERLARRIIRRLGRPDPASPDDPEE